MAGDYRDKSDLLYLLGLSSNCWKLSFCNCLIKCELLLVFMGRDEPGARLTAHGRNLLRESFQRLSIEPCSSYSFIRATLCKSAIKGRLNYSWTKIWTLYGILYLVKCKKKISTQVVVYNKMQKAKEN